MYFYIKKILIGLILCAFLIQNLPLGQVSALAQTLPNPGTMLEPSVEFAPALITGMTIHPDNPLQFDFIVDTGEDHLQGEELKAQAQKMVNYFMATLTVPEDEMWVNLSPYEKNRIIADGLGATEMGRDMLAQDYLLKQLTASLIYPEKELGKKFWEGVYKKAQALYGTTEVPVNTFNKVWILPDEASVYTKGNNVLITNSHLKVLLEEDYLALEKNTSSVIASAKGGSAFGGSETAKQSDKEKIATSPSAPRNDTSSLGSQIIRDIVIPEITKEINQGKNFANLRQIYNSMILATWYKRKLRDTAFKNYIDKNKTNGIELDDKTIKEKIYKQYLEAFKKGVFNLIKEDPSIDDQGKLTGQTIPRKYFAGGLVAPKVIKDQAMLPSDYLQKAQQHPDVIVIVDAQVLRPTDAAMVADVVQLLFGLDQRILEENFGSMENVIAAGKAMAALKRYDWNSVRRSLKGAALEVRKKMRTEIRTGKNSSTAFGAQLATDILLGIGKFANLNQESQNFIWKVFKDKTIKLPDLDKASLMVLYIDALRSLRAMITLGTLTEDRFRAAGEMNRFARELFAYALELNQGDFKQAIGYIRWILPENDAAMTAQALGLKDLARLKAEASDLNWTRANEVVLAELEDGRMEERKNYFQNQTEVRAEILKLISDVKAGRISNLEQFIVALREMNTVLLLGKDRKSPYIPPTAYIKESAKFAGKFFVENFGGRITKFDKKKLVEFFEAFKIATQMDPQETPQQRINKITDLYVASAGQQPYGLTFYRGNNSIFLNIMNTFLRLYGLNGVSREYIEVDMPQRSLKQQVVGIVQKFQDKAMVERSLIDLAKDTLAYKKLPSDRSSYFDVTTRELARYKIYLRRKVIKIFRLMSEGQITERNFWAEMSDSKDSFYLLVSVGEKDAVHLHLQFDEEDYGIVLEIDYDSKGDFKLTGARIEHTAYNVVTAKMFSISELMQGTSITENDLEKFNHLARAAFDKSEGDMKGIHLNILERARDRLNKMPLREPAYVLAEVVGYPKAVNMLYRESIAVESDGTAIITVDPRKTAVSLMVYKILGDQAMATPGGIDFNAKNLNLKEQGSSSEMPFTISTQGDQINGILPVIIKITPVTNLPSLLGVETT